MVRYENGEIVIGDLDDSKVLNLKTIELYDYKKIKENFDDIVELLEMNKLFHSMYKENLKYEVNDDLEFKIFTNVQDVSLSGGYVSYDDTAVMTLNKSLYEENELLCEGLLVKIKKSWNHLNEVEKFIIKSLEFDNPVSTDEELQDKLMYCNKKYYQYKKSGFIKMGLLLKPEEAIRGNNITHEMWEEMNHHLTIEI